MTSFDFSSAVLGRLHALFRRVEAVLILCFFSWCELKSKYLSVCVGFLYTSMVIFPLFLLARVSRKAIWPLLSVSIVKEILTNRPPAILYQNYQQAI